MSGRASRTDGHSLTASANASVCCGDFRKNDSLIAHLSADRLARLQILAIVLSGCLGIMTLMTDTPVVADQFYDQSINLLLQWVG